MDALTVMIFFGTIVISVALFFVATMHDDSDGVSSSELEDLKRIISEIEKTKRNR